MEKTISDHAQGYNKAILDIMDIFEAVQKDLDNHKKRLSGKMADRILVLVVENRGRFRKDIPGIIRYNPRKKDLEYFTGVND